MSLFPFLHDINVFFVNKFKFTTLVNPKYVNHVERLEFSNWNMADGRTDDTQINYQTYIKTNNSRAMRFW